MPRCHPSTYSQSVVAPISTTTIASTNQPTSTTPAAGTRAGEPREPGPPRL